MDEVARSKCNRTGKATTLRNPKCRDGHGAEETAQKANKVQVRGRKLRAK